MKSGIAIESIPAPSRRFTRIRKSRHSAVEQRVVRMHVADGKKAGAAAFVMLRVQLIARQGRFVAQNRVFINESRIGISNS